MIILEWQTEVIRQNCSHSRLGSALLPCSATLKANGVRGPSHKAFQMSFKNHILIYTVITIVCIFPLLHILAQCLMLTDIYQSTRYEMLSQHGFNVKTYL